LSAERLHDPAAGGAVADRPDGNQARRGLAMAGQHDVIAGLGPAHEVGELSLCIAY
jgi:hypothetical protein